MHLLNTYILYPFFFFYYPFFFSPSLCEYTFFMSKNSLPGPPHRLHRDLASFTFHFDCTDSVTKYASYIFSLGLDREALTVEKLDPNWAASINFPRAWGTFLYFNLLCFK